MILFSMPDAGVLSSRQMPGSQGQSPRIEHEKRILIVDDDPAAHDLLRAMLAQQDIGIDSAYGGAEALAKVLEDHYDLVLTDIRMPGLDGLSLLRKIHELHPEMCAIVMTAESTSSVVIRAIQEEAYTFLAKPFTRATVIEVVESALSGQCAPGDIVIRSALPNWITLEVRCKLSAAERLVRFFRELNADFKPEERDMVATAFRELLLNAIEHGGRSDPDKFVSLNYVRTSRAIVYYIRDPGEGFSMDKLPHAAISNQPEKPLEHAEVRTKLGIRPGGFGILMTKNFADELLYSEKGNEVMLIKYLPRVE